MARLTITLSDERHSALREAAARRGITMARIIDESLERSGIKTRDEVLDILARAQRNATSEMGAMTDEEIEQWAVDEVRAHRRERVERDADNRR